MARAIIHLNDVEPAPLSLRHPMGVDLDLTVTLMQQDGVPVDPSTLLPQFALLPRSLGGFYGYAMETTDAANGKASVHVPGTAISDRAGYTVELYQCRANDVPGDPALPVGLLAQGVLAIQGTAYTKYGPLGMISVPTVTGPPGPQGPAGIGIQGEPGEDGERGSLWTTGVGDPVTPPPVGTLTNDMYLDQTTGNVWQYNGVDWVMTGP